MALRVSAQKGLSGRLLTARACLPLRGGGGGPVPFGQPPTKPLPEEDELWWDDGSANPEYCLDQFTLVGKYEALGLLAAAMGVFGLFAGAAVIYDKPSRQPFAPREFPYDNLRLALGGAPVSEGTEGEVSPDEQSDD